MSAAADSSCGELSEALQRNAKHEARLSNISDFVLGRTERTDLRFFALLRMTAARLRLFASHVHPAKTWC
jgi:hypothetical protein